MRFQTYLLLEKTFAIGADVDMIYKRTFAKYQKIFKRGNIKKFIEAVKSSDSVGDGLFGFGVIDSSELKSRKSKIAHDINPIKIQTGLLGGNHYKPQKKMIQVSLNPNTMNILTGYNIKTVDDLSSVLTGGSDQLERFVNEFDVKSIKGTIYHELSHWISDSIYNFHITKMIKRAKELDDKSIMQRGGSNLFTNYEIDAQVHAIKQLKRHFNKSWDSISWKDITIFKPTFNAIRLALQQSEPKVQKDYFQRMTKRLNREKLLGKTMQKTFKYMIR